MKYVVICYAIHDKEIENYEVFDTEEEAFSYLDKEVGGNIIMTKFLSDLQT